MDGQTDGRRRTEGGIHNIPIAFFFFEKKCGDNK